MRLFGELSSFTESITLDQNVKNNFKLFSNETALKEVVITDNKTKPISENQK
jgi:hypothetical protein